MPKLLAWCALREGKCIEEQRYLAVVLYWCFLWELIFTVSDVSITTSSGGSAKNYRCRATYTMSFQECANCSLYTHVVFKSLTRISSQCWSVGSSLVINVKCVWLIAKGKKHVNIIPLNQVPFRDNLSRVLRWAGVSRWSSGATLIGRGMWPRPNTYLKSGIPSNTSIVSYHSKWSKMKCVHPGAI